MRGNGGRGLVGGVVSGASRKGLSEGEEGYVC